MRDCIEIGSSPCNEDCAQVGEDNYRSAARRECSAYISQIRRAIGPEPDGARLAVKWSSHDFGSYAEVVCYFDDSIPASVEYAFDCEAKSPANWDDAARAELAQTESAVNHVS